MQLKRPIWLVLLSSAFLLNASLENQLIDLRDSLQSLLNQLQTFAPPTPTPEPRPDVRPGPIEGKEFTAADASYFISLKVPVAETKYEVANREAFGQAMGYLKREINKKIGGVEYVGQSFDHLHLTLAYVVGKAPEKEVDEREIQQIIQKAIEKYNHLEMYNPDFSLLLELSSINFIGDRGFIAAFPSREDLNDPDLAVCLLVQILQHKLRKRGILLAYAGECKPHVTIGRLWSPERDESGKRKELSRERIERLKKDPKFKIIMVEAQNKLPDGHLLFDKIVLSKKNVGVIKEYKVGFDWPV